MSYSTGSQIRFYHRSEVVWATKYPHKVLERSMRERIRDIIRHTCAEVGVQIVQGVLARDHVHMFISVRPQLALSKVTQMIKDRSLRQVQMAFCQAVTFAMTASVIAEIRPGAASIPPDLPPGGSLIHNESLRVWFSYSPSSVWTSAPGAGLI